MWLQRFTSALAAKTTIYFSQTLKKIASDCTNNPVNQQFIGISKPDYHTLYNFVAIRFSNLL